MDFGTNIGSIVEKYLKICENKENNIFLKLNEIDYYTMNKAESICNYPECNGKAIRSHTYPQSFLQKIAKGNKIYATDIKQIIGNSYEEGILDPIKESNIKYSGTQPLFCSKHDSELFKSVELPKFDIELETYICLFSYRLYIYDYVLEREVHDPREDRRINIDKAYSKKIKSEVGNEYLIKNELATNNISRNASFKNNDKVKQKFDKVFLKNKSPNYTDFLKEFNLKYYDLGFLPEFFASGTMFYSLDNIKNVTPLQSIFSIIPDKSLKTAYFCILVPIESLDSIKPIIDDLEKYYSNEDRKEFFKYIEFLLLDAAQNIIMAQSLYESLHTNGDYLKFLKIWTSLNLARTPLYSNKMKFFKEYAYELLCSIKLTI